MTWRSSTGVPLDFDPSPYQNPAVIQKLLRSAGTVAVVGLSSNVLRPSHFIGSTSYGTDTKSCPSTRPNREILGQKSYKSLTDIPFPVDVVDVFAVRKPFPPSPKKPSRSAPRRCGFSTG